MTTPALGLNTYNRQAKTKFAFERFQWVLPGALARGSQPGYRGRDQVHTVRPHDVGFLRSNKIFCLISANEYTMDAEGLERLRIAGIDFVHAPVPDGTAPTLQQLNYVADTIECYRNGTMNKKKGAALVYCGYGQGRTGTYVAGWAMKYMSAELGITDTITLGVLREQFGVEEEEQARVISEAAGKEYLTPSSAPTRPILSAPFLHFPLPSDPFPPFNSGPPSFSGSSRGSVRFFKSSF